MEVEKRGGKAGFFQLFDWNGKSQKKLFSSKSEHESSNRRNEIYHNSAVARKLELDKGFHRNARGDSSSYSDSSISGELDYGTKAPGVVARLMGLDSLPTQHVNNPSVTAFSESQLCSDSSYILTAPAFQREHEIVIFENVRNKLDGLSRNPVDLKLQRVQRGPIERFQKEVLPPRSAKPILITQHRLLSPIKSPGFVPPKSAAYVIEAAAKMIEQSPRSNAKGSYLSLHSSSVPSRIRDLKDKMEATQRSSQSVNASKRGKEQNSMKNMKKQLNPSGQGQLKNSYPRKSSGESKKAGTERLKNKEKSVSLVAQGAVSAQKRDRLTSGGNISSEKLREHSDMKSSCINKNLTNTQRKVEKQSSSGRSSEVLSLNNRKQNCALTEDGEILGAFSSLSKERKEPNVPMSCIQGRMNRTVNRIVVNNAVTSRKTNFMADTGKEFSSSRAKTMSKKKQSVNGSIPPGGSGDRNIMVMKDEKSAKRSVSLEGDSNWDGIDKTNGLDVVSFTFSSPIKKSEAGSNSCGFSVPGGDALSVLLEQKLKELTSRVELSQKDPSEAASCSSVNNCGSVDSTANFIKSLSMDGGICKIKGDKERKGLEYSIGVADNNVDYQNHKLQGFLAVSSQPSMSGASCDTFDVDRSSSYEGTNWSTSTKILPPEFDPEISDTASSVSVGNKTFTPISCITDSEDPCNWEIHYIRDMLSSADLLWDEFALGQAHNIIAPGLFDRLEDKTVDTCKVVEEHFVLERKVLFDSVCECLELRCKLLLAGSCKFWAKQTVVLHKRQWLAEDLYREILSWRNADEAMVDELVESDMSSKHGKWTDFEVEAFEEGVEIEKIILTSLVDELFDDFLF